MLSLLTNTIVGATQATLGVVKVIPGVIIAPLDDGDLLGDAVLDAKDGLRKIGKTDD